jgi:hypothetical protein
MGTRPAPRERSPATLQRAIQRLSERLQIITQIASQVAATGTDKDPIPIVWYKRLGLYPSFTYVLDGRPERAFPEDNDVWLEAPRARAGLGAVSRGDRINVAIAPEFRPDAVMASSRSRPLQRLGAGQGDIARRTRQVEHYREILEFNNVVLGTLQIDHVHEIGLGGTDHIGNLWPLGPAANRAANATYTQRVLVRSPSGAPELKTVQELDRKYFYIVDFG